MTDKEIKAIKMCNLLLNGEITLHILEDDGGTAYAGAVNKTYNNDLQTVLNLIQKQQEELKKKDKVIDLILEEMVNNHCSIRDIVAEEICDDRCIGNNNWTCFKHIKEYFYKKVEGK